MSDRVSEDLSEEPASSHPLRIAALDGFPLAAQLFEPVGERPRALVLINGATGVRQGYYRHFASFLAARGCRVVTYDYRGIGGSRPESYETSLRGFHATLVDWGVKDFGGAIAWARETHPDLPRIVVGHSFGGQAFGLSEAPELAAVVQVAAQSGDFRNWSGFARWRLLFLWYVTLPLAVGIFGYLPSWLGIGEDLPAGVARQWARWCRTRGYLIPHVPGARERFRTVRAPLLAWSFEDDPYAPKRSVDALLAYFENAEVEHRHLAGDALPGGRVGHFGFFRTGATEVLWEETLSWLDRRGLG